jgi:hypothetical protein
MEMCWDSVVGIATAYGLDNGGGQSSSLGIVNNFLFSTSSISGLGPTEPPMQRVPGALSQGVKRQGREVDHSPPISAEVKKMWICTTTTTYAFMS